MDNHLQGTATVSHPRYRVMVLGHARHGKDTVSEILRDEFGMRFVSSSMFACHLFLFEQLRHRYGYRTVQECYDDRSNHRQEWYELIRAYNTPDLTALGRAIFAEHDVYCGNRNRDEFEALRAACLFDVAIWVDASQREPAESEDSCTVTPDMADIVLDNNGGPDELLEAVEDCLDTLDIEAGLYGISNKP